MNHSANVKDLWHLATLSLNEVDQIQIDFDHHGSILILENLQKLSKEAEAKCIEERWQFTSPIAKTEKVILRDLFKKITTWIDTFIQIGDVAIQYNPGHAALPWAGVRFLLQFAVSDIKRFDFVVKGAEYIARLISRYRIFERLYLEHQSLARDNLEKALIKLYALIMSYLGRAKRYFQENTATRVLKSVVSVNDEFESLSTAMGLAESEIDSYAQLIIVEIQIDSNNQLRKLSLDTKRKNEELLHLLNVMEEPICRLSSRLKSIEYHLSCASVNSLSWLHGVQGTGKSCLTSLVIQDGLDRFDAGQSDPPVYFHCSRNTAESDRSNPAEILASIVRQLSSLTPGRPLLGPTLAMYERKVILGATKKASLSTLESCELIKKLVEEYALTTIVIDALDECDPETRWELLEALEDILRHSISLVKIFVSSRNDSDLKRGLHTYPSLFLTSDRNSNDIQTFVSRETDKLVRTGRLLGAIKTGSTKEELKSLVKASVIKGADGMFRWAQLQLQSLSSISFEKDIRNALGRIPRKLSDLYQELFKRIMSTEHETARLEADSVLKWLLCAKKRIPYVDFLTAITIKLEISVEEIDGDMILDLLNNFVVLDGEEGLRTFRFAHLSVREFLEELPAYSIASSNAFIAETCLVALIDSSRCLSSAQFLQSIGFRLERRENVSTRSNEAGITGYALRYWIPHCCDAGEDKRRRFSTDGMGTLLSAEKIWSYYYDITLAKLIETYAKCLDRSFFLACAYGFLEIVRLAIKNPKLDDNARQAALQLAIEFGQHDILKVILQESDAHLEFTNDLLKDMIGSPDFPNPKYIETLTWLLDRNGGVRVTEDMLLCANSSEIVELLWDRVADPTVSIELLEYVAGRSVDMLRMLLGKAVKPVITEQALIRAIRFSPGDAIDLLLENTNDQNLITHEILGWAAHRGDSRVLETLLNRAIEVEISESIMQYAATCFSGESMMPMLLDHGGKLTPDVILAAAAKGKLSTLKLLISRGGTLTDSALRYGITNIQNSLEIAEYLIEYFDQGYISHYLDELMCLAAKTRKRYGDHGLGTMQKLLDHDSSHLVPKEVMLQPAANVTNGNLLVELLLDYGKQLEITPEVLGMAFSHLQYDNTLRRLMERASNIFITTQMLVAAAGNERFADEIFRFLMQQEAKPLVTNSPELTKAIASNAHSGFEMLKLLKAQSRRIAVIDTVVEAAAASGSPAVMSLLLESDQELVITRSMLTKAASTGEIEVLKLLIKRCEPQSAVTKELLDSAARNSKFGKMTAEFLLSVSSNVQITTETLRIAAAHLPKEDLKFFLNRTTEEEIAPEVLIGAMELMLGCRENIQLLLASNKSVDITENCLIEAIKRFRGQVYDAQLVVDSLLKASVDTKVTRGVLEAVTAHGESALLSRLIAMDPSCVSIIDDEILRTAATSGQEDMLKILSGMGLVDLGSTTWLHIARARNAALRGKTEALQDLISQGVDFDLPDILGRTPLSWAAAPSMERWQYFRGPSAGSGQEETVKVLLKAGSNVGSICHDGRTPLAWAAFEGHSAVVQLLLDAGADPHVMDKDGKSAWDLARQERHFFVAKRLEESRR